MHSMHRIPYSVALLKSTAVATHPVQLRIMPAIQFGYLSCATADRFGLLSSSSFSLLSDHRLHFRAVMFRGIFIFSGGRGRANRMPRVEFTGDGPRCRLMQLHN